jgi:hypothetical protein
MEDYGWDGARAEQILDSNELKPYITDLVFDGGGDEEG